MIKRKICALLAAMMIGTAFVNTNVTIANAATTVAAQSQSIANGKYTVTNEVEYSDPTNTTGQSMARNVLQDVTSVEVKEGKVYLTYTFSETMYAYLKDIKATIDGTEVDIVEDTTNRTITIEVPTIDTTVLLDMTVTMMNRAVSFNVTNDADTLEVVELYDNTTADAIVLEDGDYTVTNNTKYTSESAHGEAMARQVISDETKLNVENGINTMTLTFSASMFSMLQDIKAYIDDVEIASTVDNTNGTITFVVPSPDTQIKLSMFIPAGNHTVEFYVTNDMTTLVKVEENTGSDLGDSNTGTDNNGSTSGDSNSGSNNNGSTSGDSNSGSNNNGSSNSGTGSSNTTESYKTLKVYTVENEVSHETEIGQTMARQYLNSTSKIEEMDGKYYATLTFTGGDYMSDYVIYVDGKEVTYSVVSSNSRASEMQLRFAINSVDSEIKVQSYVAPMGRNIEFGVAFLSDTLTLVSTTEVSDDEAGKIEDTTGGSTTGSSSSSSSSNGSSSSSNGSGSTSTTTNTTEDKVAEEENVKETITVREYTIQNQVTHESETGVAMARKYLNSTSYVKEVNGTYYVTLVFTGVEFMQNHEIYVNGSKVNHTVVSQSGDEIQLRFAVASLEDSISVKTYVVPMAREVEFGVTLLTDTLTLVNEYTIEASELPNTGSTTSSVATAGLGLAIMAAGAVLRRKR